MGAVAAAEAPHVRTVTGVEPGQLYREYANSRGIRTARGGRWHVSNVKNVIDRVER